VCTAFSLGRFSQKETSVEKVGLREEPCKREFCQAGEKAKELERTSRVREGGGESWKGHRREFKAGQGALQPSTVQNNKVPAE